MRNVRGFGGVIAVAIAGVLGLASVAFACVPGHVMTPEEAKAMGQPVPGEPAVPAAAASPEAATASPGTVDPATPVPATATPRPAASPASSASASTTDDSSPVLAVALGGVGGAIAVGVLAIILTGRRSRKSLAAVGP